MISDKEKISHPLRRAVNYSLSFLLTFLFLYIAFRGVSINDVFTYISDASLISIIFFICVQMLAHFLRAVRWKVILQSNKPDVSIKHLFGALMVGYGVNCVIPRLGEVSRAVLAGKWAGVSRSHLFGTVVVERVIDIIFFGLAIIISVFLWSKDLFVSFPWLELSLYISTILLAAVVIFLYLVITRKERFYNLITKLLSRFSQKISDKSLHIFQMLIEGFTSLKGTKNYIYSILLSIIIMLLYALGSFIGFFALGMNHLQNITYKMGWILNSISSIGIAIPTPGGTGSYHALTKTTLMMFGFDEEISLAYAVLTHGISYLLFIIIALLIFFILNKQHVNLIKVVETDIEEL